LQHKNVNLANAIVSNEYRQQTIIEAAPNWHLVWNAAASHRWTNRPVVQTAQVKVSEGTLNTSCNGLNYFVSV